MNDERARKRLKEHMKLFKYEFSCDQQDEIVILYNLNNELYDDNTFSLHIENYVLRQTEGQDNTWKEHRRPSVFAKSVSSEMFKLPIFKKTDELAQFLMSQLGNDIPFCLLSQDQKYSLVNSMYPLEVEAGVVLIHEGDVGAEMYIVEEGEFEVVVKGVPVNRMHPGQVFGELALLHGIPRTATVSAIKNSRVWSAEQTSFSSIRIRDQIYKKGLASEVLREDEYFKDSFKDSADVEKVLGIITCKFIPAESVCELNEGEVALILKPARIKDEKEREVKPKDLVHRSFFCFTNLECYIIKAKEDMLVGE